MPASNALRQAESIDPASPRTTISFSAPARWFMDSLFDQRTAYDTRADAES
jgi:hypothetical protein